ncbi:MAG: hypothetical protein IT381_01040 [Deltaproteobacteria bacterium]|nr:hypothetical protein [Deltaproteobacteria bacterium]
MLLVTCALASGCEDEDDYTAVTLANDNTLAGPPAALAIHDLSGRATQVWGAWSVTNGNTSALKLRRCSTGGACDSPSDFAPAATVATITGGLVRFAFRYGDDALHLAWTLPQAGGVGYATCAAPLVNDCMTPSAWRREVLDPTTPAKNVQLEFFGRHLFAAFVNSDRQAVLRLPPFVSPADYSAAAVRVGNETRIRSQWTPLVHVDGYVLDNVSSGGPTTQQLGDAFIGETQTTLLDGGPLDTSIASVVSGSQAVISPSVHLEPFVSQRISVGTAIATNHGATITVEDGEMLALVSHDGVNNRVVRCAPPCATHVTVDLPGLANDSRPAAVVTDAELIIASLSFPVANRLRLHVCDRAMPCSSAGEWTMLDFAVPGSAEPGSLQISSSSGRTFVSTVSGTPLRIWQCASTTCRTLGDWTPVTLPAPPAAGVDSYAVLAGPSKASVFALVFADKTMRRAVCPNSLPCTAAGEWSAWPVVSSVPPAGTIDSHSLRATNAATDQPTWSLLSFTSSIIGRCLIDGNGCAAPGPWETVALPAGLQAVLATANAASVLVSPSAGALDLLTCRGLCRDPARWMRSPVVRDPAMQAFDNILRPRGGVSDTSRSFGYVSRDGGGSLTLELFFGGEAWRAP